MARTRTLANMRADVRKRADIENSTARFTDAELTRYINQGCAEVYDLLVEARGRSYYRSASPGTITTTANTTNYALPASFYRLVAIRVANGPGLEPFLPDDEADLKSSDTTAAYPLFYDLRGGRIELLPVHPAGLTVYVEYVPHFTDLSADGDTFDGINGWEEYAVDFAARCCALKDESFELAGALLADMQRLRDRIQRLAPTRDTFKPERVQDARGARVRGRGRFWA